MYGPWSATVTSDSMPPPMPDGTARQRQRPRHHAVVHPLLEAGRQVRADGRQQRLARHRGASAVRAAEELLDGLGRCFHRHDPKARGGRGRSPGVMRFRPLLPGLLFAGLIAAWIVALLLVFGSLDRNTRQQFQRIEASQQLLSSMLDQEIGVRGYLTTFEPPFLEPYNTARHEFDELMEQELRRRAHERARDGLLRMRAAADQWRDARGRRRQDDGGRRQSDPRRAERARGPIDAFRAEHAHYQELLERERDERADALLLRAAAMIVAISLALGGIAYLLLRRDGVRERRFVQAQAEFATAMQSAGDEREADRLLKRHLERELERVDVTVLRRAPRQRAAGGRHASGRPRDRRRAGRPAPARLPRRPPRRRPPAGRRATRSSPARSAARPARRAAARWSSATASSAPSTSEIPRAASRAASASSRRASRRRRRSSPGCGRSRSRSRAPRPTR